MFAPTRSATVPLGRRYLNRLYPKDRIPKIPPVPQGTVVADVPRLGTLLHNPPAAVPDVRITPALFRVGHHKRPTNPHHVARMPPPMQAERALPAGTRVSLKQLSKEEIEELRRLRREDPARWTTGVLAARFRVTRLLVSRAASTKRS
ncbi:ribosomal protein subunit L20 [Schizosaccharomyces japonicus yFS275]|uniref:Ribosomal protein subunit L20 n=1 Tax=Schizosaccharomyces japonicus (strain yFS275 / FY16936) TaxID=402676 RepID=B6K6B6_SCHJY|nr:ribosomal protein subunit L20 [Schizosaccharomyces japonicus yFS275]EEB09070.2 ribosomal protein subunit L20 [Schizosaccharomyces japonicus yFS275]